MNLCRRGHDRDVVGVKIYDGWTRCVACLRNSWTTNNRRNIARKRKYDRSAKGKIRDWRCRYKKRGKRNEEYKEWRKKNPDKVREYSRRQAEKRRAAGGKHMLFWMNQAKESL